VEVVTLADGPIEVELLPSIGARLHRLRAFGHDLLHSPDDPADHRREPLRWGGYVMAPWCNRIATGPTSVLGQVVDLPSNFTDGTAIHGQVCAAPWHQRADGTFWVQGGGDGWPWPYETTLRVTIDGSVLAIDQSLTNLGDGPMPAGIGLHPWFRRPIEVRINAQYGLRSNIDPEAVVEPVSGPWDLSAMRSMPDDLDAAWSDPGDPAVELRWPDLGVIASVRAASDAGVWVVAASPGEVDAVAVEPQTHAPFGLRRLLRGEPGGLHQLAPGATLGLSVSLAFRRP
jgi:aldose 1-epimerase